MALWGCVEAGDMGAGGELGGSCHSVGRAVTRDDGRKGKGGQRGELVQSMRQRTQRLIRCGG